MNKIINGSNKYLLIIVMLVVISIVLSVTYSNFIVTSNNNKAAEMYIGELKYSIEIDNESINTLTVPAGETIIDVKVNNLNPVDTYYKLLYLKNTNITVKYYESTKDTDEVVTTYNKPNDSITSSNSNTIKLLITNSSTSSQNIALTMKGGYITNTIQDIATPSTYSEITLVETPSTNTYFCKTNNTLTQGLKYVNGQYTYAYKQEGTYGSGDNLNWKNLSNNGWGVQLTKKTSKDAVTSKLCTFINNKPLVSMNAMFYESQASSIDLSNFNTKHVTNMHAMFYSNKTLSIDLSNLDTSNVTSMRSMFYENTATSIILTNINTSKVTDMSMMFYKSKATSLDLSSFDTTKVTAMASMFFGSSANSIDLSNFNTSKVTSMSSMFQGSNATVLDLSSFDTSKVTNMTNMFYSAASLKTIYVSDKFATSSVTSSSEMFNACTNLVGGQGTKYNYSHIDKTYAHIDGGTSSPGYFTDIADKPSTFSTDDWATIVSSVKAGNTNHYKVGDTKIVDLGTYGTHTIRVSNTTSPSECDTSGFSQTACGFVLEFADIITTHKMNDTQTNKGGWPATSMRTFLNNDIYNTLPTDLKNGIINTTVTSSYGSSDSANFTSTDKLYLLEAKEVFINYTRGTAKDFTRTLEYYRDLGVTTNTVSEAIKKNGSSTSSWWLRTVLNDNIIFLSVYGSGDIYPDETANSAIGVSPAFRIG